MKEQIGDSETGSDEEINTVDGTVAGSIEPLRELFKYQRHHDNGLVIQRALDNTRHRKTKLIISQIDEEDEFLQEEEQIIERSQSNTNSIVHPSPRNQ